METKLSKVKEAFDKHDFKKALALAAKFPDLGEQRTAIKRAHESYHSANFYKQLGHDIPQLRIDGIKALAERYGWEISPAFTPSFFRFAVGGE